MASRISSIRHIRTKVDRTRTRNPLHPASDWHCEHFSFLNKISLPLVFFFFNDTATTEIYTLSLHDGSSDLTQAARKPSCLSLDQAILSEKRASRGRQDRKSTRLNSSHPSISYAVFCLKK